MAAVLHHLRRLVAGLMLAAMATFVLHGAAIAGFGCGPRAAHAQPAQGHDDGPGIVHIHADQAADVAGHDHAGGHDHHPGGASDGPCCSSVCSVTLGVPTIDVVSAPMSLGRLLNPESQVGSGIDQGGLKRPPRTPGIA